jgi:N utilization substance protein A
MLAKLGEAGVKTLDDLGDLATDELLEILKGMPFSEEQANAAIMAARQHWFDKDQAAAEAAKGA